MTTKPQPEAGARPDRAEPQPPRPAQGDETSATAAVAETGGRAGPEPTRYGDWELKGIAVDF